MIATVPDASRAQYAAIERDVRHRIAHRRCLYCFDYGSAHEVLVTLYGTAIVFGAGHRYDPGDRRLVDIGYEPERRAA